jgi:hypothetical protein
MPIGHGLAYIYCMLGSRVRGIAKHRRLRGDDDTGEIGIDNELGINSCG